MSINEGLNRDEKKYNSGAKKKYIVEFKHVSRRATNHWTYYDTDEDIMGLSLAEILKYHASKRPHDTVFGIDEYILPDCSHSQRLDYYVESNKSDDYRAGNSSLAEDEAEGFTGGSNVNWSSVIGFLVLISFVGFFIYLFTNGSGNPEIGELVETKDPAYVATSIESYNEFALYINQNNNGAAQAMIDSGEISRVPSGFPFTFVGIASSLDGIAEVRMGSSGTVVYTDWSNLEKAK
ncbi:hypothetical protein QTG56_24320 (plasmid) [Rossellomorea sp. AcN35-11]|nr:hypothetical protein [Rossellomorea aquimaris]WJV31766.1 hypothetical protein QTG56_24320 [Rossellomorea sp. AcN35-11]